MVIPQTPYPAQHTSCFMRFSQKVPKIARYSTERGFHTLGTVFFLSLSLEAATERDLMTEVRTN